MHADALLISDRQQDLEFFDSLQKKFGIFIPVTLNPGEIQEFLHANRCGPIFCDLDAMSEGLPEFDPGRTWAISDWELIDQFQSVQADRFLNIMARRYSPPLDDILKSVITAANSRSVFGMRAYLPPDVAVQKIEITESLSRRAAVEAMTRILSQRGLPPRVVAIAVQGIDELLMNAIYDAPLRQGARYRKEVPRNLKLELKGLEQVTVELSVTPAFLGINVVDRFGSLRFDQLREYLRKDYSSQDYRPRTTSESAGLGIQNLISSGLTLMYVTEPKVRTEAMLFIPWSKTYREFKTAFQFFGCVSV